jgi:hypothetical protein
MLWKNDNYRQDNRKSRINVRKLRIATTLLVVVASGAAVFAGSNLPNPLITVNGSGLISTYSTVGGIDTSNPFFQSLGTNGRSCVSCHQPGDGWTVTPPHTQARFISALVMIQSSARTMARTVPALTSRRSKRASRRTACS